MMPTMPLPPVDDGVDTRPITGLPVGAAATSSCQLRMTRLVLFGRDVPAQQLSEEGNPCRLIFPLVCGERFLAETCGGVF